MSTEVIYIIFVVALFLLLIISECNHRHERRELYDRIMCSDYTEFKRFAENGTQKVSPQTRSHRKAIERFHSKGVNKN